MTASAKRRASGFKIEMLTAGTLVTIPQPVGRSTLFDASFYKEVLPERVRSECHGHPEAVPVVNLHLGTGRILDLCHIVHLADAWFAVQHFRDTETCADMDLAFLPYELVTMVTVSLHHRTSRRMGFRVGAEVASGQTDGELEG